MENAELLDSILLSVKKLIGGIDASEDSFDADIIVHINTVFNELNTLGVGPKNGFSIKDETAKWSDFIEDMSKFEMVKTYVVLNVKILFDASSMASSVIEAINKQIAKIEWLLNVTAEGGFDE